MCKEPRRKTSTSGTEDRRNTSSKCSKNKMNEGSRRASIRRDRRCQVSAPPPPLFQDRSCSQGNRGRTEGANNRRAIPTSVRLQEGRDRWDGPGSCRRHLRGSTYVSIRGGRRSIQARLSIWKAVGSPPGDSIKVDLSSKSLWKAEERRTERKLLELPAVHYALGGSTEAQKFFLTAWNGGLYVYCLSGRLPFLPMKCANWSGGKVPQECVD